MQNFKNDLNNSYITDEFIEKYYFNKLKLPYGAVSKIEDRERQLRGVDYIINGRKIDIKSALNYANKELKSYILELAFNDGLDNGWFLKDNDTEYYFLAYPCSNYDYRKIRNFEQLNRVDIIVISKAKLRNLLNDLIRIAQQEIINYRNNPWYFRNTERFDILNINDGNFSGDIIVSKWLEEKPINLKMHKDFYLKYCSSYIMIYKDNYYILKNHGDGINKNEIENFNYYQQILYT